MVEHFPAFLALAFVVIATPGPDTALVIRNSLLGGRREGVCTAAGVATGQAVWTVATAAGIAALLVASRPAFEAVKLAGAAYLIFLGAQTLAGAVRGAGSHERAVARRPRSTAERVTFRQGVISNLANPKSAVFFTSLLPQFASPGDGSFVALAFLGLVYCLMTLAWLSGYALAIGRAGAVLRRPRVRRAIDAATGAVLVAFGLRLAADRR